MALPSRQAQPDREALPVDNRMDFGDESALGSTEAMISIPLFAVAACWCARMEVVSIIWMLLSWAAVMASIIRSHTPPFAIGRSGCKRWCAGRSARADRATAQRTAKPRRCRSIHGDHQPEVRRVTCWAGAVRSRATRSRSSHIGSCRR